MTYNKLSDNEKKTLIEKLYTQEKKSFAQIAADVGTYANKIRRDAAKFNIDIRDKSEAQKNALKKGNIEHPTKGKKRSEKTKEKIGKSVMNSWESLSETEIQQRKLKAKQNWESMDDDKKNEILQLANEAVRNSSKTGSKLEKFVLNKLLSGGYQVDFHKEHNLLNTKLQIDLFIPKLNTAIEIDGPSHFLPVWGEEALNRNVKYDNKKTGLLLGKGCVIIRVKQTKDFSPSRAKQISDQILDTLKNIESSFPSPDNRIIQIGD
jgi:very-short-patch-repair endonuclease